MQWNIQGMIIGNGWISGRDQALAILSFAYVNNLIKPGSDIAEQLEAFQKACVDLLANSIPAPEPKSRNVNASCRHLLTDFLNFTQRHGNINSKCINRYDIRVSDQYPACGRNWPPDIPNVKSYLNRKDVLEAPHCDQEGPRAWEECSDMVAKALAGRQDQPVMTFPSTAASSHSTATVLRRQGFGCESPWNRSGHRSNKCICKQQQSTK